MVARRNERLSNAGAAGEETEGTLDAAARGAGVALKGRSTVFGTTWWVLIPKRGGRVDWLVGRAGILWLDVTGAGRS